MNWEVHEEDSGWTNDVEEFAHKRVTQLWCLMGHYALVKMDDKWTICWQDNVDGYAPLLSSPDAEIALRAYTLVKPGDNGLDLSLRLMDYYGEISENT